MIEKTVQIRPLFIFLLFTYLILNSCESKLPITGNRNDAVQISVNNFIKKNKLSNENNVFNVTIYDPLNKKKLIKVSENEKKWVNSGVYENLIVINIFGDDYYKNKYSTKENLNQNIVPNQFIEVNNKLFIWKDENLTNEKTDLILKKYGVLTEGNVDTLKIIDDAKKGTDYYFCKNNLRKFKITIDNIATGYIKPPKLDCK